VPSGIRLSTISVAYATTPRTTIRLDPSDSVTRTRPAGRSNWPITASTNPPAVTYAMVPSDAGRPVSANQSAARATRSPTVPTTFGAGGCAAIVQTTRNNTWTPKTTRANG
jgi:hypothetical protein